jgi:large subunit ribosomal protein L18
MNRSTVQRVKRHRRVRKKVSGTPERPRLAVFRSNRHLYAQLIDDIEMRTLASASTLELRKAEAFPANSVATAEQVGKLVAERAMAKGLKTAVFDRGGFRFHGKVRALAEGARQQGLIL